MDKENMPIQCTNDGCTDEFANEKELLHHLFVGKCHFEIEFKSSANSDITKKATDGTGCPLVPSKL
jgi:hypothetical protein